MRRLAYTFARLTGLVIFLYGTWMFTINLIEDLFGDNTYQPPWVLYMVLGFGLVGGVGGALYLLSLDGPERFRRRTTRMIGWAGMLICAVLPASLSLILSVMVGLSAFSLFDPELSGKESEELGLRSG